MSPSSPHSYYDLEDKVAATLLYLMTEGSFAFAGQFIGMSKTRTITYATEIIEIICQWKNSTISIPKTDREWTRNADGFEELTGMPNCVDAIDGTLIEMKRFQDFEGKCIFHFII